MAFDFPASPTEGQQFTPPGGPTYQYNAPKWLALVAGFNAGNIPFTPVGDIAATNVQSAIAELATEPKAWRNRIINGDFAIDQRWSGASASVPAATVVYGPDRWYGNSGQAPGAFVLQRVADSTYPSEFNLFVSPSVADASLAAGDFYFIAQVLEGNNCRGLNWGTANARSVTISFNVWATNNITLPLALRNAAGNRTWLGSFAAGPAWSRVTLTVPGDTTGTWTYDNLAGIHLRIALGAGTTFQGVAGWQAGTFLTLAGMTNVMAGGNDLRFKDFQLELGSVATEFERVDYSEQLARCQRYYETSGTVNIGVGWWGNTTSGFGYAGIASFKAQKRTVPTIILTHIGSLAFAAATGSTSIDENIIAETRVANGSGSGSYFLSSWKASAEL